MTEHFNRATGDIMLLITVCEGIRLMEIGKTHRAVDNLKVTIS